jgi:hypothetical protein
MIKNKKNDNRSSIIDKSKKKYISKQDMLSVLNISNEMYFKCLVRINI